VVEDFHQKSEAVFGDVSLSKNQVRTINGEEQSPGSGGWPSIRYFSKDTGYGGKAYEKKTDQAMCDELGPKEAYMQEFVESMSGASLCDVKDTSNGCSEEQIKFIGKWTEKPKDAAASQVSRLNGMVEKDGSSMKPEALKWIKQRIAVLKQLSTKDEL